MTRFFRTCFTGYLILVLSLLRSQTIPWGTHEFTMLGSVPADPVEDQGTTGTCWSFSTTSYIQTECQRLGKPIPNLSDMFYVRMNYLEKAVLYLRFQGKNTFDEGSLAHDIIRLLGRYGAMPEEAYMGLPNQSRHHNHLELKRELKTYLDAILASRRIPLAWQDEFNLILDRHLGPLPQEFLYEGEKYTALAFARKFIRFQPSDYVSLTSFLHHPSYSCCALEIPDNYSRSRYVNITLADLRHTIFHALKNGHTVVWDCDVSERGFMAGQGLAFVHSDLKNGNTGILEMIRMEPAITAESRQVAFDNYELTDDHLMHIVGWAKDEFGKNFYYVKNSWGMQAGQKGYLMASQNYVEQNTIAITLHRDAIPQDLWKEISTLECGHH